MTSEAFLAFYPQFADSFPPVVLETYVALANARFDLFLQDAEEARRLYVAHKLTLYAKTAPAPSPDSGSASFFSTGAESTFISSTSKTRAEFGPTRALTPASP